MKPNDLHIKLIGKPLGHSYSKEIHAHLAPYRYSLQELERDELESFFTERDFDGLNVTIPYKEAVIPYLTRLSNTAATIGAVNTVVKEPDGTLTGYNTDYPGFLDLFFSLGIAIKGKKALVLGSGGASKTVVAVLKDLKANPVVISRRGENNYQNLDRHTDAALIVNTTPVGMYPNNGNAPLSLEGFPRLEGVLDLIYNPARTALLLEAEARGIPCKNGLLMLVAQARSAAEHFTKVLIPRKRSGEIEGLLKKQTENIILIGMPGVGKTTLGKALAECLNRPFVDTDALIEKQAGMTIPDILQREGERGFRARESEVLKTVGRGKGQVIATGGGCVTIEENYAHLHQNGRIVFLNAPLCRLATEGRPLSQARTPEALYREREPLYRRFSDVSVALTKDKEKNISLIKEAIL